MKETGVIRRVDNLGRVVLPIHFRKKAGIYENDDVVITIDENNQILINKYNSFLGMTKLFDNILIAIYQIIKGTILIVDEEKIISSYGVKTKFYNKEERISLELKNRMKREPNSIPDSKLIADFIEENHSYVYPLTGRHGKVVGAIVYIFEKDLLENISQILSSYAIFISEMLKES